jgi:hypothetical protein
MQDAAKEMMNSIVVRSFQQNLAVQCFCFLQLTGSVMRKRPSKNVLAYILYNHAVYRAASSRKKRLSSHGRDAP